MHRRRFLSTAARGALVLAASSAAPLAQARGAPGYLAKMARFDEDHGDDLILGMRSREVLANAVQRMSRVQSTVGHGRFALLGFDRMLSVARAYSSIGAFSRIELEMIERIFHGDARRYGFLGEKVLTRLTDEVARRETEGVPGSGQRVFRGRPGETFRSMRAELGERVVLTSGVRSLVKQTYLFLRKAHRSGGNLSRASRSLAPPGYSFHAIGDFDVGERGLGSANFTDAFARTRVYRRLADLGFLAERYPFGNRLGVRYEPWHVKIV